MLSQIIPFRLTFVLILYMRLLLETHAVPTICQTCTCRGSSINITCKNRGLISVPQTIPPDVVSLDLSQNEITTIKKESFQGLSNLKHLWLHDNKITNINEGSFQSISNLKDLDLSQNEIRNIEEGYFKNLSNLVNLDLSQNEITTIEKESFQGLSNLKHLWLQDNKITSINEGTFENLSSLEDLSLLNNSITKLEKGAFQNLPNLMILYLKNNEIKKIEKGIFQSLVNLRILHLEINEITIIEAESFQNLPRLQTLWLYSNKIMNIEGFFQKGSSLRTLSLLKNDIKSIGERDFQNLTNLMVLYLEHNKIKTIENGAFQNLVNLRRLHLDNNEITIIKEGTFQNLLSLETLWLYNNEITDVEEGSFKSIPNLHTLSLLNNKITNIKNGTFQKLPNLKSLYMEYNQINKIEKATFQNLANLKNLHLDNNKIMGIEKETFQNLTSLEALYLYKNEIKNIEEGAFQNLGNLRMLSLLHNDITYIGAGTFNTLGNLRTLNLSNNRIQDYEDGTFLFLSSITNIDLRHNSMACRCHLPAFVDYMNQEYSRHVNVFGSCLNEQNRLIEILKYSQCESYKLFQQNLQCQTCSTIMCTDSDVTSCPGAEPVCQNTVSMTSETRKLKRFCSTYRKCTEAMRNNALTCNTKSSETSCVGCCTGKLCSKSGFNEWYNTFEFHLIYTVNPSLTSGSQNQLLNKDISKSLEHEFLSMTGVFEVEHCGMQSNKEIFTISCAVQYKTTKDQVEQNIRDILKTSQTLHNLGIRQDDVEIIGKRAICNEDTILTDNIFLIWPITKVGTFATIPCHANIATRYCSSSTALQQEIPTSHSKIKQKCTPFTGVWQKPNLSQCNNTKWINQKLKDIKIQNIDEGNIEKFSRQLWDISKKSVYFKEEDFQLAVDIHEKMVPLISKVSTNITLNNILLSINNMEDTPEGILDGTEQSNRSVTRMLNIIETIPDKISLEEQQVTVLYSNLGIGVIRVEKDTFNGASFGVLPRNQETKAKTLIYSSSQPEDTMKISISLPRSLFKHLKNEEQSSVSRISFFFIEDDKLYRVIQTSSTKEYSKITSHIISANVLNIQITNLEEPVKISFNLVYQNQQCAYWDESSGQKPRWSTNGCNTTTNGPGDKVVCSCNHLTSFTLLDVEQPSFVLSHVSCGISLVLHILIAIFYGCIKKLRRCLASKILISLCISLAVVNIIFLIGMQPYALKTTAACKAVAALLHYSLIATVMWMGIKVFHAYIVLVTEGESYEKYFMIVSSILAWGLPALITLAVNFTNNYIRVAQVCWLSKTTFYITFLTPVVIVCIFHIIFSFLIQKIMRRHTIQEQKRTAFLSFICVFFLLFLLRFSWLLTFLAFDEAAEVFDKLFSIFNLLQSLLIFLFYCINEKYIRHLICKCAWNQEEEKTMNSSQNLQMQGQPRISKQSTSPQSTSQQSTSPQSTSSQSTSSQSTSQQSTSQQSTSQQSTLQQSISLQSTSLQSTSQQSTSQQSTSQQRTPQPVENSRLTESDLLQVAKHLGPNWKHVGIFLGIDLVSLENIKHDHANNSREQSFQMLTTWFRGSDCKTDRVEILREAIENAECYYALEHLPKDIK